MAAEVKISELRPAAALAGNELVEVVQGGANRQTSVAAIAGLVPPATPSASGLMSAADKAKLDGIAPGATANSPDATLLNRANHTGAQSISTITGLQAALDGKAPASLGLNNQTGATYTLVLADANTTVARNNAAANTTTVPPNSSVAFPIGTSVVLYQAGAGASSIAPGAGVTIRKRANRNLTLSGQYAMATLLKVGTDEWVCSGDLEAV